MLSYCPSPSYLEPSPFDIVDLKGFNAAHTYWLNTARHSLPALSLACRLNISICVGPNPPLGPSSGLLHPVRRLVITGEDIPKNFELFFGPEWKDGVVEIWEQCRIQVLLAGEGGPMASLIDPGSPFRSPRGPDSVEETKIERYRKMQKRLASNLGMLESV